MCYLCLEFLISMACVVMLWRVCVSYFSFSLFGLLRHVVSSTLSCSPIPVDSGWIIEWCWGRVISYTAAVITCRTTCVCVCECVLMLLVHGNDCYYSRAGEADTCCLRNQTCYVSLCVFVLSICRLQEDRCTICFVVSQIRPDRKPPDIFVYI